VTPTHAGDDGRPGASPAANLFIERLRSRHSLPLVVAHRGDSARAPENSLRAAELARAAGADAWEFDVQLSRDGVPVVIHDESLLRTTDVARRFPNDPRADRFFLVSEFDFDEIRSLDAGSWFLSDGRQPGTARGFGSLDRVAPEDVTYFASGEVRVPSLREALEWTARQGWLANIELKSFPNRRPDLLDATLAEVEAVGIADRVLVSSFDHRDVARVRTSDRRLASGALAATPLFAADRYVIDLLEADCYHPSAAVLGADSDLYRAKPCPERLHADELAPLRRRGVPVLVYTVNDPRPGGLADHLAQVGVDAIFTDDPGPLRALFRSTAIQGGGVKTF
jgi:glycerophosphoryl diester phosphodiesterase